MKMKKLLATCLVLCIMLSLLGNPVWAISGEDYLTPILSNGTTLSKDAVGPLLVTKADGTPAVLAEEYDPFLEVAGDYAVIASETGDTTEFNYFILGDELTLSMNNASQEKDAIVGVTAVKHEGTQTVTLDNVTLDNFATVSEWEVVVKGENFVKTAREYLGPVIFFSDTTLSGDGSLTVVNDSEDADNMNAIWSLGNLTVQGIALKVEGVCGIWMVEEENLAIKDGATVDISAAYYGICCAGGNDEDLEDGEQPASRGNITVSGEDTRLNVAVSGYVLATDADGKMVKMEGIVCSALTVLDKAIVNVEAKGEYDAADYTCIFTEGVCVDTMTLDNEAMLWTMIDGNCEGHGVTSTHDVTVSKESFLEILVDEGSYKNGNVIGFSLYDGDIQVKGKSAVNSMILPENGIAMELVSMSGKDYEVNLEKGSSLNLWGNTTLVVDKHFVIGFDTGMSMRGSDNPDAKLSELKNSLTPDENEATEKITFLVDGQPVKYLVIAQDVDFSPFADVDPFSLYAAAIQWAYDNQITTGVSAAEFGPTQTCTRAQVITFLWRYAGCPEAKASNPFVDVPKGSYYEKAVVWAYENQITAGVSATKFAPQMPCTRAQAATFLWRYAGCPEAKTSNPFVDVKAGSYYVTSVAWAYENEVTAGTSATAFSPDGACLREQIVTFLWRYHNIEQ